MAVRQMKIAFVWDIKYFLTSNIKKYVKEITTWRGDRETKWELNIGVHPSDIYFGITLRSPGPQTCRLNFSFINKDGERRNGHWCAALEFKCLDVEYKRFLAKSFKELEDILLRSGTLRMYCIIVTTDGHQPIPVPDPSPPSTITLAYEKLFNDGSGDVKILVEGREFNVHKTLLASRSPVFEAMLASNMLEAESKTMNIIDFSSAVMEDFLAFLYTNRIEGLNEKDKVLLVVADKYDVAELKRICSQSLARKLCVDTVAELLLLADRNNCEALKRQCMTFMKGNSAKVVVTRGWKVLEKQPENVGLLAEVIRLLS